jgi:Ran GTPase-activating protein (RanGAP) involved in mRNA processing and transport
MKTVKALELMENKINALGCEFIGNMVHPKTLTTLQILKLDHNEIGADGLKLLAEGMAINKNITSLSLTYCGIEADGARSLFEILIFT